MNIQFSNWQLINLQDLDDAAFSISAGIADTDATLSQLGSEYIYFYNGNSTSAYGDWGTYDLYTTGIGFSGNNPVAKYIQLSSIFSSEIYRLNGAVNAINSGEFTYITGGNFSSISHSLNGVADYSVAGSFVYTPFGSIGGGTITSGSINNSYGQLTFKGNLIIDASEFITSGIVTEFNYTSLSGEKFSISKTSFSYTVLRDLIASAGSSTDFSVVYNYLLNPTSLNGNDNIIAGVLNDNLNGYTGNDILNGGLGDDTLDGGLGIDKLNGGAGNDTYTVDLVKTGTTVANFKVALQDSITEAANSGTDSLILRGTSDQLNATTFTLAVNLENLDASQTGTTKLNLTGNTLNNHLIANDAANILNGGTGIDIMEGGAGSDIYFVDNVADTVIEVNLEDIDLINASVSFTLGEFVENLTLTGAGNINGTGNDLNNTIIGTAGNNSLNGGAGADNLKGGAGNDTYFLDDIGDLITDSAGIDNVVSSVSYTLALGLENLALTGSDNINGTGNDSANSITGNDGYNFLVGGLGNDTLDGGLVSGDNLSGGAGNDTYIVDDLTDTITENDNEGIDTIRSGVSLGLSFYPNIENLTLTGSADINAIGSEIANTLIGNTGSNQLTGGAGIDTLQGGKGDDTYFVDLVAINNTPNATLKIQDMITENVNEGNADAIVLNAGAFSANNLSTITLGNNIEKLYLDSAIDIKLNVLGNALNNYLTGNNLGNKIDGGVGSDAIYGNEGDDTLIGGVGNDNLNGNDGSDSLDGGAGNDTLDGDTGSDTLAGGAGNDIYYLDDANDAVEDIIIELAGTSGGIDTINSMFTYSLLDTDGAGKNGGNVENLTLIGVENINGTGNILANYLTGNEGNNSLMGGAGNDTLTGGIGVDELDGGVGNDTYLLVNVNDLLEDTIIESSTLGGGIDTVKTIFAGYALGINIENLVLLGVNDIGGSGNDLNNTITGNDHNNSLIGFDGNDMLFGGIGNDNLQGGVGNDLLDGGLGLDIASYSDALTAVSVSLLLTSAQNTGGAGTDKLVGIENLVGSNANDTLTGNALANDLNGGVGNDTLTGGAGSDTLTGGLGNDVFDFNLIADSKVGTVGLIARFDTLVDFNAFEDDKIDLSTIDANTKLAGNQAFTFIGVDTDFTNNAGQLRFDSSSHMLFADVDGNGIVDFQIELVGVTTIEGTGFIL